MDFMKVFDQTVREIKREVNLKVLKVPEIEQKVLDSTDNEPWGPHGSALSEIAHATKKFTECQMVMNVLWTRLKETDKDWRHVYKALTVIEYLVANGSERAVDDIIEHTFQISSLSTFEYVEPSGKDVGLNVRKKAETIVGLLNNKDKIQEARNKATANRDKYVGLSSSGITYKSSSASYSSGGFGSSDRYGGSGGTREGSFRDSYKDREKYGEEKTDKDTYRKSRKGATKENQSKESTRYGSKGEDSAPSNASKSSAKLKDSDKYNSAPSQSSSVPSSDFDDDFDPRGIASTSVVSVGYFGERSLSEEDGKEIGNREPDAGNSNQVDLFGDFMDAPAFLTVPAETSAMNSNSSEVDLFDDAAFVSAPPQVEKTVVDLFPSQPTLPSPFPTTADLFSSPDPVQPDNKAPKFDPTDIVDPFAAVPLTSFDGSDPFGDFTSNSSSISPEPVNHPPINGGSQNNLSGKSSADSKPSPKKDTFQVKSGIWADSLSRGLIDLNISAPKKASLLDVGIMGGLSGGFDEKDKEPPTSLHMGRAMGAKTGLGLGNSGFPPSSQGTTGDDFFSSLGNQPYQYGGFRK